MRNFVYIGEIVGEYCRIGFLNLIRINSITSYGQLLHAHAHPTGTPASSGPGGNIADVRHSGPAGTSNLLLFSAATLEMEG